MSFRENYTCKFKKHKQKVLVFFIYFYDTKNYNMNKIGINMLEQIGPDPTTTFLISAFRSELEGIFYVVRTKRRASCVSKWKKNKMFSFKQFWQEFSWTLLPVALFTKRKKKIKPNGEPFNVVTQGRTEALGRRSKSLVVEDSIGAVAQVTEKWSKVNKSVALFLVRSGSWQFDNIMKFSVLTL